MRIQESQPSRPKLPPFNAKHVIAAKEAAEKNTPSIPEFSDLLVNNFATGRSSGAEAAYLQNRGLFPMALHKLLFWTDAFWLYHILFLVENTLYLP